MLYDGREHSPSSGALERFVLGRPDEYKLLHVPPGIWYSFAGRSETPSLVANLADRPHQPDESERLPLDTPGMPDCRKL
jgi:dTDP-4-dehydrorhamnose 3,5-epimerase